MKQDRALEILTSGKNIFLTGSAGTGKTYLIAKYMKYLKDRSVSVSVTAPTGIAASHLGGQTIHSFFGLGLRSSVDDYYIDILLQKKYLNDRMRKLKVLVIDEVSMVSPEIFESIDKILKAFKFSDEPFGGVQVILSGDFFQLPPVSKQQSEKRFIFQSQVWKELDLKTCYLQDKFRQDDSVLIKILDEIREGKVSEESMEVFRSRYRKKLSGDMRPTKLYTHNIDVDRINQEELASLKGKPNMFKASTKGSRKNIDKIFASSLLVENLQLKEGSIVIFIKNDFDKGYVNGTLGKVVEFEKGTGIPLVEIFSGRKVKAEKKEWALEDSKGKIVATVNQVPLRLAWAITVHKSQGMTLDAAEMDLSKTFEEGQGYVALSRLKSIEGLRIMGLNKKALEVSPEVLKRDTSFQEESDLNDDEYGELSEEQRKEWEENFLEKIGGSYIESQRLEEDEDFDPEKFFQEQAKEKEKDSTYQKTWKLLEKEKSLRVVAQKRELSYDTVMNHLKYLSLEMEDQKTLNKFKPEDDLVKNVQKVYNEIRESNNEQDFLDDGSVKLKSLHEKINSKNKGEEISYNEIKLALIFIEV